MDAAASRIRVAHFAITAASLLRPVVSRRVSRLEHCIGDKALVKISDNAEAMSSAEGGGASFESRDLRRGAIEIASWCVECTMMAIEASSDSLYAEAVGRGMRLPQNDCTGSIPLLSK